MTMRLPKHVRYYAKTGKYRAVLAIDGKRVYGPLRDSVHDAAEDALKLAASRRRVAGSRAVTLAEGFGALLQDVSTQELSKATEHYYRAHYRALTGPCGWGADLPLEAISTDQVRRFLDRRQETVSVKTSWYDIGCLRRIFSAARARGWTDHDPIKPIRKPKTRTKRFEFLPGDEIRSIADKIRAFEDGRGDLQRERVAALVEVLFYTGIRRSEASRLRVEDIDFQKGTAFIHGKTGNRTIPLSKPAKEALRSLVRESSRPGFVAMLPDVIGSHLSRWKSRLGLPYFSAHVLRHSFGTEMADAGVQPFVLAGIMGHADIKQTMNYYHGRDVVQQDAVSRITGD